MRYFNSLNSCTQRWTLEAIRCYQSGCNCSECETMKNLISITKKQCAMKAVVLELVRKYGIPNEETIAHLRDEGENEEWIK